LKVKKFKFTWHKPTWYHLPFYRLPNTKCITSAFYVGGYQPAQKWLKDCNGRTLSFEGILHYQEIIVALTGTDRLMKEIDENETNSPNEITSGSIGVYPDVNMPHIMYHPSSTERHLSL
jgi:hypothetical protein